jgi:hypothetical protein
MSREYHYALTMYAQEGRVSLGQVPVTPDWGPALESARFEGIRRGQLPAVTAEAPGWIEPVWNETLGQPYLSGFQAVIQGDDGVVVRSDVPTAYVRGHAQKASASFVEKGDLKVGEVFTYVVSAFPAVEVPPTAPSSDGFSVEEVVEPLPLGDESLRRFVDASVRWGELAEGDLPVFIPQRVLDEAVALSREAKDIETGSILIGKLHRDREVGEIFVEVSGLIKAQHTLSSATKLTFTPETWAAVDAALALRRRQELPVGWAHYHPDWCARCPAETRRQCTRSNNFFSADDVHLHHVCFSRAFQIALLISDNVESGLSWSLFGWRRGIVEPRGFYILQAQGDS